MFCTKCGASIADNSKFCTKCGNQIVTAVNEPLNSIQPEVPSANPFFTEEVQTPPVVNRQDPAAFFDAYTSPGYNQNRSNHGNNFSNESGFNNAASPQNSVFRFSEEELSEDFGNKTVRVKSVNRNGNQNNTFNNYSEVNNSFQQGFPSGVTREEFFPAEEQKKPVKKKKAGKIILKILIGIVIVALAVTGGIFGYSYMKKNSAEAFAHDYNMTENSLDVTRDGKNVFYTNENGFIVKADENGKEREIIVDDTKVDIMYIKGDKLYYHSVNDDYVYSCSFSGGDNEKVILNKVHWFALVDKTIYYIDGYSELNEKTGLKENIGEFNLYSCDINGENSQLLIDDEILKVSVQSDSIVYTTEQSMKLYKTDKDGKNEILICEADEGSVISSFKVYKDKIYYSLYNNEKPLSSGIYSVDADGKNEDKIISTQETFFTIKDDKIIYSDSEDEKATYMCSLDGKNKEILLDGFVISNPKIYGEYMYFYEFYDTSAETYEYSFADKSVKRIENNKCGKVVFVDDYIFYIDSLDSQIYRSDADGKNRIRLTDGECLDIFSYDNEIYFYGYVNGCSAESPETNNGLNTLGLYKLDKEGASCTAIKLGCKGEFSFYENEVYFTHNDNAGVFKTALDKADADSEDVTVFNNQYMDFSAPYFIYDGYMYLTTYKADTAFLSRISLETSEVQDIFVGNVYNVQLSDKKIYFMTTDENGNPVLFQIDADGSSPTVVLMGDISDFTVFERTVYYIDPMTEHVKSIAVGSQKPEELNETASADIVISSSRIYYTDKYDNGYLYSMNLDGSDIRLSIGELGKDETVKDRYDYRTYGIDGADAPAAEDK